MSIEILLYPALILMPYFFFKEIIIFFNNPNQGNYIALGTLLATAAVVVPFFFGDSHSDRRPLARPIAMYIIESVVFSTYFVIFRSFESFRLPQQTMMQISVSFILVLFVLSSLLKSRLEFRKTPFNLPVLLITLLSLFSFIMSPNFMISFKEFIQFFFIVMNFFLIIHCLDAKKHFNMLMILVIASMGIEALIGFAQHFGLNEYIRLGHNFDPFSTLGNKNYVAEMLAMTIPFSLAVSVATSRKWIKALVWLAIAPMLFVIIVAITRGSWIGLIGGCLMFLFFAVDKLPAKKIMEAVAHLAALLLLAFIIIHVTNNQVAFSFFGSKLQFMAPSYSYSSRLLSIANIIGGVLAEKPVLWIGFIGVFLFFAGSAIFLFKRTAARAVSIGIIAAIMAATAIIGLPDKTNNTGPTAQTQQATQQTLAPPKQVEDSIVSRNYIWGGSIQMIKHYPLGVGLGAFKIRYLDMLKAYLASSGKTTIPGLFKDVNAKEAHCEYLHMTAEMGPLAPIFILFFAWTVLSYFLKTINAPNAPSDTFTQIVALGSFSSLVSISLSAALGFPFHIMGPAMLCGVHLAMLVFSHDRTFGVETLPLILPGYKGPAPIVLPKQQEEKKVPKKKKGKKNKRRKQEPVIREEPDTSWKKHWAVVPMDLFLGIVLLLISIAFFIFITLISWNWQMSNIHMKTANFMAKAGQTKKAADLYDLALKLDRYNGDIHLFRGMFLQKQGKREEAIKEFTEANRYYDLPQISLDLGALYFEKGPEFYDKAEKSFKESRAVYPNYAHPRYNIGLISYQKALAITNDPSGNPAVLKYMNLEGVDRKKKALELFKEASDMFTEAIELNPRLITASFKLALSFEKMYNLAPTEDKLENAIKWYEYTIRLNPAHADAYYNLGLLYTKQASMMNKKVMQLEAQGKNDEAAALKRKAAATDKKSGALFDKAVKYNPKHTRALNNRGNQLFNEGKVQEALDMYLRAIKVEPNYVNSQLNIALAYIHLNKFDKALTYLDKLKKRRLEPQHEIKVAYMLGTCHMNLGRQELAENILSAVVKKFKNTPYNVTPEYISAVIRLADVENRLKKYDAVIELLSGALDTGVARFQEAETLLYIGQAYYYKGDKDKSAVYLEKLVRNFPGSGYDETAKQFLRKMGKM